MLGGCSVMKRSNRPQQLHTLPSSANIDWSKYESKHYLHFDKPINIAHLKRKLQDPKWVASYPFLPSIHFNIDIKKYVTVSKNKSLPIHERKKKKTKRRQIYYAAHKDRFIYKYYGDLLNDAYNEYADSHKIDKVAIAYRKNKGKSTIDSAFEVFKFIFEHDHAVIISIDFTSFFDNIDHRTLKRNIKDVLGVRELPLDWYKVYRSLTQFTYVRRTDVDAFLKQRYGVKELKRIRRNRQLTRIMEPSDFRSFKEKHLFKNKKPYGIPQGSGMSAVCSNVHLVHFDKEIKGWADRHQALYRRYSVDLILVVPISGVSTTTIAQLKNEIFQIILKYRGHGLKIQTEKTDIRLYANGAILDQNQCASTLDYLGFVTDGSIIRLREKSLFKYYCRAYRKADTSKRIAYVTQRKGPRRKLYQIYTHLGMNYKRYGNFISYAYRAHKKMSQLKAISHIRNQVKRHWNKIHKRL